MRWFLGVCLSAAVLVAFAGSALAQEPNASPVPSASSDYGSSNLCVTVAGKIPQEWTIFTLIEAIKSGTVSITGLGPDACPETPQPTSTAEPTANASEPQSLVVGDIGFTAFPAKDDDSVAYAVLVTNPNHDRWVAEVVPVDLAFLDKSGDVLATDSTYVTLLPDQTTAIVDTQYEAGQTASIEVTIGDNSSNWSDEAGPFGSMSFERIKTRTSQYGGTTTTGRIVSDFSDEQDDVRVLAVYRNKAGKIIGGTFNFVDAVKGGASVAFSTTGLDRIPGIAKTEMYYQLPQ